MSAGANAVFLSYASQDADPARRICEALRAAGLEVWFDQSELRGGDAWDQSIRKKIKECALFVPIISANTQAREEGYFRLEWKLAVDRSHLMADDKAFFLPVVIDDTPEPDARVPEKFRERQWSRVVDQASAEAFAVHVHRLAGGNAGKVPKQAVASASTEPITDAAATPRRSRLIVAAFAFVALAALAAAWLVVDHNRKTTFVAEALVKIEALSRSAKFVEAYQLARETERIGGGASLTDAVRESYSREVNLRSNPPGAKIAIRPFSSDAKVDDWIELGTTPMAGTRVPRGAMEWRATLPDHQPAYLVRFAAPKRELFFALWPAGSAELAMVPVSGGEISWGGIISGVVVAQKVKLEPYLIDREEVTNREFTRFVQAGGYTREEFWKMPFRDGARPFTFKEAMARFRDATGRAGPATWKLGSYPDGEADLPVRGISWYEAAAYAAFAGKELPTIYHWYFADTGGNRSAMPGILLPVANFESNTVRSAANAKSVSAYGAVNMAGNVREWVSNATDHGRRLAVGGSLTDIAYQYAEPVPRSGFDRTPDIGMRCMKRSGKVVETDPAMAVLNENPRQDPRKTKPVSDAEYAVFTRFFEQRAMPLDVKVESVDDTSAHWVRNKVSFAAGYGGERLNAFLYLPRNAKPPFQTLIFMSGSGIFDNKRPYTTEAEVPGWNYTNLLLRGGRAVLVPIWKGSFERSDGYEESNTYIRAHVGQWLGELRQSLAFLATRPEIDQARIGYYGISFGAEWGVVLLAREPRLKTGILFAGGMSSPFSNGDILPPEVNNATYAPRIKVPVLMLNGRNDLLFPYETAQVPLFKLLGSPAGKKKHKTYPGGHFDFGWYDDMLRDTHDWLDEQFGPVTPVGRK